MKKYALKYQFCLWALILIGLGFLSTYSQNSKEGVAVFDFAHGDENVPFEQIVPLEFLNTNAQILSNKHSGGGDKEVIFEVQEEEDDKIINKRLLLSTRVNLQAIPWFTQTNNYSVPMEFLYGKRTSCIYLKKQVFLI